MDNDKPVPLLPSISKVFEKVVFDQLCRYLRENNLFYPSQYGCRSEHFKELATLELTDRTLQYTNARNLSLTVFMDLSKHSKP